MKNKDILQILPIVFYFSKSPGLDFFKRKEYSRLIGPVKTVANELEELKKIGGKDSEKGIEDFSNEEFVFEPIAALFFAECTEKETGFYMQNGRQATAADLLEILEENKFIIVQ